MAAFLLKVWAATLLADALLTEENTEFGSVRSISAENVVFSLGEDSTVARTVPWTDVDTIIFNDSKSPVELHLPTAGLSLCGDTVDCLEVFFKDPERSHVYARTLKYDGGKQLVMELLPDQSRAYGPVADVITIVHSSVCKEALTQNLRPPPDYCVEPKQWAVNFSYDAVSDNHIFTRGFSFFYRSANPSVKSRLTPELIRQAFGTAIVVWTSAVQDNLSLADDRLKTYIQSVTYKSSGKYTMLVPPQVINVECIQSANFVVIDYPAEDRATFDRDMLAKAQVRGRTVLLNSSDYEFGYKIGEKRLFDGKQINLITVLAHELGHAFGLSHSNEKDSIMNPTNPADKPSKNDVRRLVQILSEKIAGEMPGTFDGSACEGLHFKIPDAIATPMAPQ